MRIKINTQVEGVVNDCTIDDMVHNGTRLMNEGEENFMTETRVLKCMKGLKIKNSEGVDRIPLRVLNDRAEILSKPETKLLDLIYQTKLIPNKWKWLK